MSPAIGLGCVGGKADVDKPKPVSLDVYRATVDGRLPLIWLP
jgi:hypothetical protein